MEFSLSMAMEYMNNFRLDIYWNSHAEQKQILYKTDERKFSFVFPL